MNSNANNNDKAWLFAERIIKTNSVEGFWSDQARSLLTFLIKDATARLNCEPSLHEVLQSVRDDTELSNIIWAWANHLPNNASEEELKALALTYVQQDVSAQAAVRLILINALADFLNAETKVNSKRDRAYRDSRAIFSQMFEVVTWLIQATNRFISGLPLGIVAAAIICWVFDPAGIWELFRDSNIAIDLSNPAPPVFRTLLLMMWLGYVGASLIVRGPKRDE